MTFRAAPFGDFPLGSKTVIGIVSDAVWRSMREPVRPTIYFPLAQRDGPILVTNFYIGVRSLAGTPRLLTRSVTAALTAIDPNLTLTLCPVSQLVNESLAQDRLVAA